ncbi:MAG TPA: peptidoglycan bridge formation glycyltransferase FemA/FemB family protein [Verrucomicrobiae bacterium]|nr:peptidoglycan bridge formation glycyltransferase FemA/FemB family protein [Verrucomicrobiae bacterium]
MTARVNTAAGISVREIPIDWHQDISIYASKAFLRSTGDQYGWIGGFNEDNELLCVLPYTIVRKAILRLVRFRTETISLVPELSLEEETEFLLQVTAYFRGKKADVIVPASANALFRTCPPGSLSVPYGSFVLDLTQSEEILLSRMHSKHRNVMRSASRKGVRIEQGLEHTETAHRLIHMTLARSKMEFLELSRFKSFVSMLGEQIHIFVAFANGEPQGAAAIPFSRHAAYYLYGGSSSQPVTGAMNLLHWEAIRHFQKLGTRRYDFMGVRINPEKGSKQEGLMMFKERFGGDLHRGHMWKCPLNRLKYALYLIAARARSGGDVVDQERHFQLRSLSAARGALNNQIQGARASSAPP